MTEKLTKHDELYSRILTSALAENTRVAYEKGWNYFSIWCDIAEIDPLSATPENIVNFF